MALSVAVYHFSVSSALGVTNAGSHTNEIISILGNYGVEGFFIVSGFCFFHLYGRSEWSGRSLANFHIKRFFRIAPLFYAAILANALLGENVGWGFEPRILVENLSFTFGLSYNLNYFHPNHSLVLGGWSIGLEYMFYFAFPLMAFLTRRTWAMVLLLGILIWVAYPWTFHEVPMASLEHEMKFHTYVRLPNHAFLFLLGGLLARIRSWTAWRLPLWGFALSLLAVIALGWPYGRRFYDVWDVMSGLARVRYVGLCFLVTAAFAFYEVPRTWLRTALVHLGDTSYSVYLLHPFMMLLVTRVATGIPALLLGLVLTLGLATLVYRYMERPAMGLGKRLAGRF